MIEGSLVPGSRNVWLFLRIWWLCCELDIDDIGLCFILGLWLHDFRLDLPRLLTLMSKHGLRWFEIDVLIHKSSDEFFVVRLQQIFV